MWSNCYTPVVHLDKSWLSVKKTLSLGVEAVIFDDIEDYNRTHHHYVCFVVVPIAAQLLDHSHEVVRLVALDGCSRVIDLVGSESLDVH